MWEGTETGEWVPSVQQRRLLRNVKRFWLKCGDVFLAASASVSQNCFELLLITEALALHTLQRRRCLLPSLQSILGNAGAVPVPDS